MALNEEVLKGMDEAARAAEESLKDIPKDTITQVADWWRTNYTKAGHKRLAKILLGYATKKESY
jgi:hypothetical protein